MSSQEVLLVFDHERVYCRIAAILSDHRVLNDNAWIHGYYFLFFATFDDRLK